MEYPKLSPEILKAIENDYTSICEKQGRGICGISRFAFTTGLVYGIDETGYAGRWCYENSSDAVNAILEWDGISDPPGEWIKYKGKGGERSRIPNPFE